MLGEPPKLTFKKIMAAVIAATKVPEKDIMGKSRVRYIKHARWMVIHLTRKHKAYSYPHIASLMGMQDHTSILHACREFPKQLAYFTELGDMLETAEYHISNMVVTDMLADPQAILLSGANDHGSPVSTGNRKAV